MLLSLRLMFILFALLPGEGVLSERQTAKIPQFQLTVWSIRPQVKRLPTADELRANPQAWMHIIGFDDPVLKSMSDDKLTEYVRKQNSFVSLSGIDQKSVSIVPADKQKSTVLPGNHTFSIIVKISDREHALAEIGQHQGKAMEDEYRKLGADEIVIYIDVRIPHLDSAQHPTDQQEVVRGYRAVKPGCLYAINPDLSYNTSLSRGGQPGIPAEYTVKQLPQDILLFCLEPIAK